MRKTNSQEILREDFGCYPPNPLKVDNNLAHVQVEVRPFKFFRLFVFKARTTFALVKACFTGKVSTELLTSEPNVLALFEGVQASFKNSLTPFRHALNNLKSKILIKKVVGSLQLLGLFLVSCILVVVLLLYFIYLNIKQTLQFQKSANAFFYPSQQSSNQIMYNAQTPNSDLCWYISHEHLHLLQTHFEQKANNAYADVDLSVPRELGFLKASATQGAYGDYMEYLFLRHETEARLHELVLVYYRANGELVLDLNGFLRMLLHFECFLNPIRTNYPALYDELPHEDIQTLTPRSPHMMRDLERIVFSFENEKRLKAYLFEVLPKMYANLLCYYGDKQAAEVMSNTIPSTSLY